MNGHRRLRRQDTGEVGVGTLIVFIAMVLVAAVAAAVLIGTAGTLQQRASSTGMEATAEVSSNLQVTGIQGKRNSTTADEIYDIRVQVELSAGATPMDLTNLLIRYSNGVTQRYYNHSTAPLADGDGTTNVAQRWFNATWIRGAGTNYVMESGDLVELHFNGYDNGLDARTSIELTLLPETGSPVIADFKVPPTFGSARYVTMR